MGVCRVAGGGFEGGEAGGEGDVEERDGGKGEECVVGLGEEVREGVPSGRAVEFLKVLSISICTSTHLQFEQRCRTGLVMEKWVDIPRMLQLLCRVEMLVIHMLVALLWDSFREMAEGTFWRELLIRGVWLDLVSGQARCTVGSGA